MPRRRHLPAFRHRVLTLLARLACLQILVSKDQRRRLEQEAKRRKSSVASVIRDAVDAELGEVGRGQRLRAVSAIAAMKAGPHLDPDEMRRLIDDAHAEEIDRGFEGPGRT